MSIYKKFIFCSKKEHPDSFVIYERSSDAYCCKIMDKCKNSNRFYTTPDRMHESDLQRWFWPNTWHITEYDNYQDLLVEHFIEML